MIQYHPSNPFRPVNWRWENARAIREGKVRGALRKTTDQWVLNTHKFQIGLAKCKDDLDRYDLMSVFPDLYSAYLIFNRGGADNEQHPMRYVVEARILAAQNDYDIARRLGIPANVIDTYEKVFFNVRERLENSDYIMTCVIGPSVHAGLTDRDYDLLWKLFGYIYGPVALDSFISTTTSRFRPENLSEVDAVLAEDARASIQRKVAIVARTYTVNPFSQSELLNVYTRLLEMEKETGSERNRDVILQNVQVMLDKLPFQTGIDVNDQPTLLDKYDATNVELNTTELMSASTGKDVVDVNEMKELKFPEPKPNVTK